MAVHNNTLIPDYMEATRLALIDQGGLRYRITHNMKNGTSQVERILHYIRKTGSISQREAYLEFNVQAFTRRIADIREMGIALRREDNFNPITGQKYARYFLEDEAA